MSTEDQLSLFAGDSPVSHSVLPGNEEARKMTEHSGKKCIESYERYSQLGSLVRMLLGSSAWNSTTCFLTWKMKVTPHKRLYFQLVPSMPDTEETESSSSPTKKEEGLWNTPLSSDWKNMDTANQDSLSKEVKMWATPSTMDHLPQRSPEALEKLKNGHRKGRSRPSNLREQVDPQTMERWLWPTPSASQAGAGQFIHDLKTKDGRPAQPGERAYNPKTGNHSQITLNRAVHLWPTPTAMKGGEGVAPSHKDGTHGWNIGAAVQDSLSDNPIRLWPTPTVNGNHNRKGLSKTSGDGLSTAVKKKAKQWPTPTSREYKGARSKESMEKSGRNPMTNTLSDSVEAESGYQTPEGKLSGSLNPMWVEWLMGYPIGWTDSKD